MAELEAGGKYMVLGLGGKGEIGDLVGLEFMVGQAGNHGCIIRAVLDRSKEKLSGFGAAGLVHGGSQD